MEKDQYYQTPRKNIEPFSFNQEVANVFEDMLKRSIPFYDEIHKIILDLLSYHFSAGDRIYDLGCSTGSTLDIIAKSLGEINAKLIGIDNSTPMLEKAKKKLSWVEHQDIDLQLQDVSNANLSDAQMVIMNYTLQFVPITKRVELLSKIHQSLGTNGVFVLTEKIEADEKQVNDLLTNLYYDFKRRNGYSDLEISQKREALENVLNPLRSNTQLELLKLSGFKKCEMIFRWYNFACFVGIR